MARRLAALGHTVLLPNIFYRTARPPVWEWPRNMAEERSRQRFAELTTPVDAAAMERDTMAYLDFLTAHPAVSSGKLGVVGYCFSGQMALRAAAVRPQHVAAVASFHGGGLWTDRPTSPHLVLPRVAARLYFGHAVEDHSMPPPAIEHLDAALADWGGRYESEVYAGARHGWTLPDNPVYNPPQAEHAFDKLRQLLAETLR
jgi:carboxymethylenebutenolidase